MHAEDIKAELKKAGSSQTAIARAQRCSVNAVRLVIHGDSRSAAIAGQVSRVVGIPVHTLWPDAYPQLAPQPRKRQRAGRKG